MSMADCCRRLIRKSALALALWLAHLPAAFAAGAEPAGDMRADPGPCLAAAASSEDDKVISACGALIGNEKTAKPDRVRALLARAGAYDRREMIDAGIADYSAALLLGATQADTFNARGELWRRKGDRPRALADFAAALKLNPDHAAAKGSHKSLAQELEQVGALIAVHGKPSFNCATARRAVEKAICASAELANLDREINVASARAVNAATRDSGRALQREQDEFLARRNAAFGRPDYDLRQAMRERLDQLNAISRR